MPHRHVCLLFTAAVSLCYLLTNLGFLTTICHYALGDLPQGSHQAASKQCKYTGGSAGSAAKSQSVTSRKQVSWPPLRPDAQVCSPGMVWVSAAEPCIPSGRTRRSGGCGLRLEQLIRLVWREQAVLPEVGHHAGKPAVEGGVGILPLRHRLLPELVQGPGDVCVRVERVAVQEQVPGEHEVLLGGGALPCSVVQPLPAVPLQAQQRRTASISWSAAGRSSSCHAGWDGG